MDARSAVATLALLGASACFVDLDLTGKACSSSGTCVAGYACDLATNTCMPVEGSVGSGPGGCPGGAPLIQVSELRALWATPNTIRWGWTSAGDRNDFLSYELVVGQSPEDVEARQNVVVFGPEQNPELGRFLLERTGGIDEVVATSSDGLAYDTEYFAQLYATDTTLCAAKSNIAGGRTGIEPLLGQRPVLVDEPGAFVLPDCAQLTPTNAYAGSAYEYHVVCVAGPREAEGGCVPPSVASTCWVNLNLGIAAVDLSSLSPIERETAYLEFALRIDQSEHAYWGATGVGATDFFTIEPLTFRSDGNYRLYQIALSAFVSAMDVPLSDAVTMAPINGFQVGGNLNDGATLRLDEVYVRW